MVGPVEQRRPLLQNGEVLKGAQRGKMAGVHAVRHGGCGLPQAVLQGVEKDALAWRQGLVIAAEHPAHHCHGIQGRRSPPIVSQHRRAGHLLPVLGNTWLQQHHQAGLLASALGPLLAPQSRPGVGHQSVITKQLSGKRTGIAVITGQRVDLEDPLDQQAIDQRLKDLLAGQAPRLG